jgi:hypothetical protein
MNFAFFIFLYVFRLHLSELSIVLSINDVMVFELWKKEEPPSPKR